MPERKSKKGTKDKKNCNSNSNQLKRLSDSRSVH